MKRILAAILAALALVAFPWVSLSLAEESSAPAKTVAGKDSAPAPPPSPPQQTSDRRTRPYERSSWRHPANPLTWPSLMAKGLGGGLGFLVTRAEKHRVYERLMDILTSEDGTKMWYPFFDYTDDAALGGIGFYDLNFLGRGKILRGMAMGGQGREQNHNLTYTDPALFDLPAKLDISGRYQYDPHWNFYGVGNDSPRFDNNRMAEGSFDWAAELTIFLPLPGAKPFFGLDERGAAGPGSASLLKPSSGPSSDGRARPPLSLSFSNRVFRMESALIEIRSPRDDPDDDRLDAPGIGEMNWVEILGARGRLDLTDGEGITTRGLRLEGGVFFNEHLNPAKNPHEYRYLRTESQLALFIPLFFRDRVLALRGRMENVRPLSGKEIPYWALPTLGGEENFRGYKLGRFRDRHYVLFTQEYRFPLHPMVDAVFFVEEGIVAARLADIRPGDFNISYGGGIRARTKHLFYMRLQVGASRENVRFVGSFNKIF